MASCRHPLQPHAQRLGHLVGAGHRPARQVTQRPGDAQDSAVAEVARRDAASEPIGRTLPGRMGGEDSPAMEQPAYKPRWHCRLHLFHRWRTYSASDGGESYRRPTGDPSENFQQCLDCGKYRNVGFTG
jgi:hypothetical protein